MKEKLTSIVVAALLVAGCKSDKATTHPNIEKQFTKLEQTYLLNTSSGHNITGHYTSGNDKYTVEARVEKGMLNYFIMKDSGINSKLVQDVLLQSDNGKIKLFVGDFGNNNKPNTWEYNHFEIDGDNISIRTSEGYKPIKGKQAEIAYQAASDAIKFVESKTPRK